MKNICKSLILASLLVTATEAFAQSATPTPTWQQKKEAWQQKRQEFISSATDASGMVTQASLESAMESRAQSRADRLFQKLSPNTDPVTPTQLSDFLKNQHMGKGDHHHGFKHSGSETGSRTN